MRLATEFGPQQRGVAAPRWHGSSTAPPTPWTATATSSAKHWLSCPVWDAYSPTAAATSSTSSGIYRPSSPHCATATQIVSFQNRLATLTSVLDDSRSDLDAALRNLSVAVDDVKRFVAGSRDQTSEQIQRLANVTQKLVDNETDLENVLHVAPNASPTATTSTTRPPAAYSGRSSLNNFANPVGFICGAIGAIENTTAPETAKLCAQYLGPALRC